MLNIHWYERPVHRRAARGGETSPFDGVFYRGGEMMPFYVPRPIMPQIDEADYDEFLAFAEDHGVKIDTRAISPWILHPHQRLDPLHVQRIRAAGVENKRAFVSIDLYILDGNHRWMLHMQEHTPLPSYQINLPFGQAIELMFKFPKTYALVCHREDD